MSARTGAARAPVAGVIRGSRRGRRRSRHSSALTGCTERREFLTSTMSARRGVGLDRLERHRLRERRDGPDVDALPARVRRRSSSGWASAITSTTPTTALIAAGVVEEAEVARLASPSCGCGPGSCARRPIPGRRRRWRPGRPSSRSRASDLKSQWFIAPSPIPRAAAGRAAPPSRRDASPRRRARRRRRRRSAARPRAAAPSWQAARAVATPSTVPPGRASPAPSARPRAKLRDCAELQVSDRSPRPERPASVSGRAPIATARRVISAKPRVISAARAEAPRPGAVDHAAGDGDDVLQRAAELGADHVVGQVEAQAAGGEAGLQRAAEARGRRRRASARSAGRAAISPAKPGPVRAASGRPGACGGGDLGLQAQAAGVDALGAEDERRVGQRGGVGGEEGLGRLGRQRRAARPRRRRGRRGRRRRRARRAGGTPGSCGLARAASAAACAAGSRPQSADRAALGGLGDGERGAEGAGADRRRSRLGPLAAGAEHRRGGGVERPARAGGAASRPSGAPVAMRSAAAQAIIAPLSVQSAERRGEEAEAPASAAAAASAGADRARWPRRRRRRRAPGRRRPAAAEGGAGARRVFSASVSATAAWKPAQRSARSARVRPPCACRQPVAGAADRGLQAGEGEVAAVAVEERPREGEAGGVAVPRPRPRRRGRRAGRGRGASPPCRRPRRGRRRWCRRGGGSRSGPSTARNWQWPPETSSIEVGEGDRLDEARASARGRRGG